MTGISERHYLFSSNLFLNNNACLILSKRVDTKCKS